MSPVLHGLVRKRGELSGEVAKLRRQLALIQADIQAVDRCLVMLGYRHAPETIRPIERRQREARDFNVTAFILDVLRDAPEPVLSADIASMMMDRLCENDRSDEAIRRHALVVLGALRSLKKRRLVTDSVDGWRIADE